MRRPILRSLKPIEERITICVCGAFFSLFAIACLNKFLVAQPPLQVQQALDVPAANDAAPSESKSPTNKLLDASVTEPSITTSESPADRSIEEALGLAQPKPVSASPLPRLLTEANVDEDANNLASPKVVAWLRQLIRDNLPETYEDARKWDLQKEVWDGVDFSREGLQIKTKRKHKLVNHGTWTRYRLQLIDPDHRLDIQFYKLEIIEGSKIQFDVSAEMLLDVFGRLSQWVRDVQLVSISANADAVCKLSLKGTVGFRLNPLRFPPEMELQPHIDQARVDISYFRVRRISQLGGPLAAQLGNGLRHALESKLEESNAKLPEKINKQLDKHQDRLRFSMQDWLQSKLPMPTNP